MAITRKIKEAKDLSSGELIYFKGHAKATYMSDGSTVEDAINSIQTGTGGGIISETDPIFSDSPAASITEEKKAEWDAKQDKLLSGTNIKTINGTSILGSGNITISDGGNNADLSNYVTKTELASVATSGSYNDLTNKPTIPSAVTESTISGWGFTKNSGTITGIKANGTSIATSGVANIPAASTSAYGVTKLSSSTSSTSTSLAATASAVKSAYDLANGKQDKLTSGTNIKTINGQSILGSGNITISGGSSSGSSSAAYGLVEHGTSDTTFTLTPNTFHIWGEVDSLTLTLGEETAGVANEYLFQFDSGDQAVILTLPESIKWSNSIPVINSNKTYQVSVLNKFATLLEFEYTKLITFTVQVGGHGTQSDSTAPVILQAEEGMTWKDWINSEYNNGDFSIIGQYLMYDGWYFIENLNGGFVDIHSVIDQDVYLFANYN